MPANDPQLMTGSGTMARNLNAETHFMDARAMVAFLDAQPSVDTSRRIGTTGYCMGGPMVMRTVAAVLYLKPYLTKY